MSDDRPTCRVPDCQKLRERAGAGYRSLCSAHRARKKVHGDVRADVPIQERDPDLGKLPTGDSGKQEHESRWFGFDPWEQRRRRTPVGLTDHFCSWLCRDLEGVHHKVCGHTFADQAALDRHMYDETRCTHPTTVGLIQTQPRERQLKGIWYDPATTPRRKPQRPRREALAA